MNKLIDLILGVDNWVLDGVCQPFANKFQRLTGQNNFFLARCLVFISFISEVALVSGQKNLGLALLVTFIVNVMGLAMVHLIENMHNRKIGSSVTANNIRTIPLFIAVRLSCLLNVIYLVIERMFTSSDLKVKTSLALISLATYSMTIYFASCTPLPPQRGKLQEWLSSVRSLMYKHSPVRAKVSSTSRLRRRSFCL